MARRQDEAERLAFALRSQWREWLSRHHDTSPGVFVVYPKKASRLPEPTYEDLTQEALCFGWIGGTLRPVDEQRTSLYFAARRKAFDALPAGTPKELIYRVDSAKRPDTRERRAEEIARALGAP